MNAHHDWRRDTRKPAVVLPALSCDCAVHVFDPARVVVRQKDVDSALRLLDAVAATDPKATPPLLN